MGKSPVFFNWMVFNKFIKNIKAKYFENMAKNSPVDGMRWRAGFRSGTGRSFPNGRSS
jgi:hypothetical protein